MIFLAANGFYCIGPPFGDEKNDVMKYTWPAHTPSTRNILRTDIHVWVLADDEVTRYND